MAKSTADDLTEEQTRIVSCPTCRVTSGVQCTSMNRTGYAPIRRSHPARRANAAEVIPAPTITGETLTNEQIETLLDEALYCEWPRVAADCHVALHGVKLPLKSRRHHQRYSKTDPAYHAALDRVAKLIKTNNDRMRP